MEKYSERFNDIVILQLNTEGFEKLSEKQKKLAYHLSNAGLWGRMISLDQGSQYNIPLFNALIELYGKVEQGKPLYKELHDSLFMLFAHNGIYHSTSGEKLTLPLTEEVLTAYIQESELVETIKSIWFSNNIPQFRTVQTDGVDVVKESGGNFYNNLTTEEVNAYRQSNYPKVKGDEVPPFGFNERLVKNENGSISREVISEDGLYGPYVKQIINHLIKALEFTENDQQYYSINTLIDFYKTGDAFDFDKHCVAWAQDRDSHVYFINGLIESYEDPLGVGCTFESVVAFKNPLQTAKVNKIIDNIQWLENNLPFDKSFKKDKAVGLSASSINVISMAGDTSPSLPLGINLPNSDWIRKKHGSKSVSLANVSSSRSTYEVQIREALFLKKYHSVLEQYGHMTNDLHTDLHEIAGHGSGKTLEGVNTDIIGAYYSTIEESRADLVALYYMAEPKLKDFGVYDSNVNVEEAALAQYVSYLTNGAIGQLRRVELGNDLTQPHFRNRQLIALWVLEHADKEKVRMVEKDGMHYVEVNDINHVKELFGKLLEKVQTIKSTGDFEAAKELVMTYGTKINQEIHAELLERMKKIDMPKVVGFITPMLVAKENTVVVEQSNNFFEQQIALYKEFGPNSLEKKIKHKM
jgi:dipeptidyl-peptidase-3